MYGELNHNNTVKLFFLSADDVLKIKDVLNRHDCHNIRIISKIENSEGVENLDEIIRVSDGIMVARGDMGVEIDYEKIPAIQKMMIKKSYSAGKQVITATQMLDSMIKNPRPTRAETTDVANAIYDGTGAIMLSGETAAGAYPVEALRAMVRIAVQTEADIDYYQRFQKRTLAHSPNITNAISEATVTTAHNLTANAIVTVSKSGQTAAMISKYRPACPIIGCSFDRKVLRQMNLSWGVIPVYLDEEKNTDLLFQHAIDMSVKQGVLSQGDLAVITAGVPLGISGTTNMIKVHMVGNIAVTGTGVTHNLICANLCVCKNAQEAKKKFVPGEILVIPETDNSIMSILKDAAGIITEQEGLNSHAAVVGLTLDKPVIVGVAHATELLRDGLTYTMDAGRGIVCNESL
jgi:pyruvate kinase